MKVKFELTDEVTITNTSVKVSTWITGVVNGQDRPALEAKALELAKNLFPDAKWAFSNFIYQPDGFTWRVQATTRIDATQNDQLAARAEQLSQAGQITIQIYNIDESIPLHQKREAESNLRVSLIDKAKAEATKLGGKLSKVVFGEVNSRDIRAAAGLRAASASYMDSTANSKGGGFPSDGVSLGHSEKIFLSAVLTIDTSGTTQLNG